MNNRIRPLLTFFKNKGLIENIGSDAKSIWVTKQKTAEALQRN